MNEKLEHERAQAVENARTLAGLAEETAVILDQAAVRRDGERRRATAAWEREVARVERHNADEIASGRPLRAGDLLPIPPRPPEVARAAEERTP